ncbi:MAG TPA: hypothetical protein PKA37_10520 [Planctomycetota bacterium]|nr:hypothetical protein [Planctomycetota bacterium]
MTSATKQNSEMDAEGEMSKRANDEKDARTGFRCIPEGRRTLREWAGTGACPYISPSNVLP